MYLRVDARMSYYFGAVGMEWIYFVCGKDMNFGSQRWNVMDWMFMCPPNLYVEALMSNVMVFGDGRLWEIIRVRWYYEGLTPIRISVHIRRGRGQSTLSLIAMWGHSKKASAYKPGRLFSTGTKSASTLILDSQPPELWEINFCCLNYSVYGIFYSSPSWLRQVVCFIVAEL